jgi:hydroxypyruvate reductase
VKSLSVLRSDAADIWSAALRAVDPETAVRKYVKRRRNILEIGACRFDLDTVRHVWILGAGKAAAPMGRALEKILGKYLAGGFLTTKYGHGLALEKIEIMEAGHPLPDKNSLTSAERVRSFVQNRIEANDLVLCVFSGGASSLLVSPAEGITLEDKLRCSEILMHAGAAIHELNSVRKHLSTLKGGGLARLLKHATVVSLALSDVVGDDIATIASGPTAPDPTTFSDCMEVFRKLGVADRMPRSVAARMKQGIDGRIGETLKRADPDFKEVPSLIIGNNATACSAAVKAAKRAGYHSMVLTSRLEGDTASAAGLHMSVLKEILQQGRPLSRPACVISGGETTVEVTGKGRGGRNQEFVLHCVPRLAKLEAPALVASLGTDGTDGPTDAAGAFADNSTLTRSLKFGTTFLEQSLENNDSYAFFKRLGNLIVTGPTRTNVMDLHIMLVG